MGWYRKSWPPLALAKSTCTLSRVKKTRRGCAPSGTAGLRHRRRLEELMEQTVEHCKASRARVRWGELGYPGSCTGAWRPTLPPSLGMASGQPRCLLVDAHLQQAPLKLDTSLRG